MRALLLHLSARFGFISAGLTTVIDFLDWHDAFARRPFPVWRAPLRQWVDVVIEYDCLSLRGLFRSRWRSSVLSVRLLLASCRLFAWRATLLQAMNKVHIKLAILHFALIGCLEQAQVRGDRWCVILVEPFRSSIYPLFDLVTWLSLSHETCMDSLFWLAKVLLLDLVSDLLMAQLVDVLIKAWSWHHLRWLHV